MKKQALTLFISIFIFGFINVNSVLALVQCPSGDLYSAQTGEPCTAWTVSTSNQGFKLGDKGTTVAVYQRALNAAGFGPLTADGIYGPKTAAAAARYQASIGGGAGASAGGTSYNLSCLPYSQNVTVGAQAKVGAYSTFTVSYIPPTLWTAPVSWSAPGGTPASGSSQTFTTSYSSAGNNTITVTSGGLSSTCNVAAVGGSSSTSYTPPPASTPPLVAPTCAQLYPGDTVGQNLCEQIKTLQSQVCSINPNLPACK